MERWLQKVQDYDLSIWSKVKETCLIFMNNVVDSREISAENTKYTDMGPAYFLTMLLLSVYSP